MTDSRATLVEHPLEQAVLTTERLILRPFTLDDVGDVQRLAGEFAVADTTLNLPHPYRDGMAEAWVLTHNQLFRAGVLATFAIVIRTSGELIGAIGLRIEPTHARAELGYWIGVPFWGQGYCTEAARAMLGYAFGELRLGRVHATHLSRNPASGRVMQKLGMRHEGHLRQHVRKWDKMEDLDQYGILNGEFERT